MKINRAKYYTLDIETFERVFEIFASQRFCRKMSLAMLILDESLAQASGG